MITLPLLTALHSTLSGNATLRGDIHNAVLLAQENAEDELTLSGAVLSSEHVIEALHFTDAIGNTHYCGFTPDWPDFIPPNSTREERTVQRGGLDLSRWTRDELLTALHERPDPRDAIHAALRREYDQRTHPIIFTARAEAPQTRPQP